MDVVDPPRTTARPALFTRPLAVWLAVALSAAPDWRWLLGRDDSPWYPTLRLFRQPKLGDWPAVFARMAAELAQLAG